MDDKCPWCKYNKGTCLGNKLIWSRCDFRELPMERDAILQRMRVEKKNIEDVVSKKTAATEYDVREALDRAAGLIIMAKVLEERFGMTKEQLQVEMGSKELSWSQRMKLALMVKLMQKEKR